MGAGGKFRCIALLMAAGVLLPAGRGLAVDGKKVAADIRELTGARTRIVWLRGVNGIGGFNPFWDTYKYKVMVFDTDEAVERAVTTPAKIAWPRLTPDGKQVLYNVSKSELKDDSTVRIVDWDGRNNRVFTPGYVYDTWRDPATGHQWAYIGEKFVASSFARYRIDDPSIKEVIFTPEKGLKVQECMVSGDGKYAIGLWPHPLVALMDLATAELGRKLADGCNMGIAPDDSHRYWYMDGRHRFVHICKDGKQLSEVAMHTGGEGLDGREVWNPGWTNDVRFFTINGPYERLHLAGSNIYIGRFDEALTKVEKFVRVTNSVEAENNQHAWIAPKVKSRAEAAKAALLEAAGKQMADAEALLEEKKYWEASVRLEAVIAVAPRSEPAGKAREQLKALRSDKLVWAAVEKGRLEHKAAQALAEYEKGEKKRALAERLTALEALAKNFPGTEAGRTAAERAAAMRADPEVMRQIRMEAAESDCKSWLSMARNYIQADMPEKAKPYLDKVLQQYPDTLYAEEAKKLLAKIPGR